MKAVLTPPEEEAIVGVGSGHPTLVFASGNSVMYEYEYMPALKAETPLGGYSPRRTLSYSTGCYVTSDAEDPDLCMKLIDFMCSHESLTRQRYGEEGVDFTYAPESEWVNNIYGYPCKLYVKDGNMYSSQSNQCWHTITPKMWTIAGGHYPIVSEDDPWAYALNLIKQDLWNANRATPLPDEVVYKLNYNLEENEVYTQYHSGWKDYITEARALFISGTMDPNSDADWNTYLNTLKANGEEDILRVVQSAYDRVR